MLFGNERRDDKDVAGDPSDHFENISHCCYCYTCSRVLVQWVQPIFMIFDCKLLIFKIIIFNFARQKIFRLILIFSALTQLPMVYASFVDKQYLSIFAITSPFTNPFKYNHYTVSLAHYVIGVWFLKCRLPIRINSVAFITSVRIIFFFFSIATVK